MGAKSLEMRRRCVRKEMWENIKVMFEMEFLKRDMNQVYNVKIFVFPLAKTERKKTNNTNKILKLFLKLLKNEK